MKYKFIVKRASKNNKTKTMKLNEENHFKKKPKIKRVTRKPKN